MEGQGRYLQGFLGSNAALTGRYPRARGRRQYNSGSGVVVSGINLKKQIKTQAEKKNHFYGHFEIDWRGSN